MKKTVFTILTVLFSALLLCCCGIAESDSPTETEYVRVPTYRPVETEVPTTAAPEFDSAPALSETVLCVDGVRLPQTYQNDGALYVCMSDLTAVLPVTYRERIGTEDRHTCTVTAYGYELEFSTTSTAALDSHTVHDMGAESLFDGEDWYLPVQKLLEFYGFHVLEDTEQNTVFYTTYPANDTILADKDIPVLMYHAVSDNCWGSTELFVSPSALDAQIAALLENGYTLITFEDFDRLDEIEKPVMLTFDDGYDDNYKEMFPILQKYQVKATVFVITNDIGKNHKVTAEQVTEMSASGLVSIQSHTQSHNYLSYMNETQLDEELSQSKLVLARLTGKEPFVLCYPTGMYSGLSLQKTAEYYEYGLLMGGGLYNTDDDPYMIGRFYVPRGLTASQLLQRIR